MCLGKGRKSAPRFVAYADDYDSQGITIVPLEIGVVTYKLCVCAVMIGARRGFC